MKKKCNKCINKPWKECCNNCKELEYSCYVFKNMVKVKDYIEHLGYHYSDPDQYLTCSMCNVYKHISLYRFRNRKCRLCIYLHRSNLTRLDDLTTTPSETENFSFRLIKY